MESSKAARNVKPRIIIHGGAGNIRRENLPKSSYEQYQSSLLAVLASCEKLLQTPGARALDVATHAVSMLEDNPLFNAGKGAVFTRVGMNELESSIMVSDGYRKRAVGCMLLTRTKNPIKLAREVLIRGEEDNGGGAQGHCQLSGESLERMGADWGLELVNPNYFFTQKRWQEHLRGLEKEKTPSSTNEKVVAVSGIDAGEEHDPSWDGEEYLPQGTVGAVVLDSFGTICVATSTGGLTNKLPGRIGDTPTIGAGFWAEEWESPAPSSREMRYERQSERRTRLDSISRGNVAEVFKDCLSGPGDYTLQHEIPEEAKTIRHAVGMSGTGNGDSFLRTNAVRTAAAMSRFAADATLRDAIHQVAGPGGELERSAGKRWGRSGEGEGGIIGIELIGHRAEVISDFNCGGMFRAWVDDNGDRRFLAFRH